MERTTSKNFEKLRLQDAINCSASKDFTPIPNDIIRSTKLSMKAKSVLCILLSNKEGWKTHLSTMKQMVKEGESSIRTGMDELIVAGYVLRIRFRNSESKVWVGSFWAYTDIPWYFDVTKQYETLATKGLDPHVENPHVVKLHVENPHVVNQELIILTNNNIKVNKSNLLCLEGEGKSFQKPLLRLISAKQFNRFWSIYPNKGSKGNALTTWNKLCSKKNKPGWKIITSAIYAQILSEQWQDKQFIPLASTWLNQSKWLDDPEQMISYSKSRRQEGNHKPTNTSGTRAYSEERIKYREPDETHD